MAEVTAGKQGPSNPAAIPAGDTPALQAVSVIRISPDRPWYWLAAGARDIRSAPGPSLLYGLVVMLLSLGLTAGLVAAGLFYWLVPALCGFMFVAPIIAVGFYEMSRKLEAGERPTFSGALRAYGNNATQIALMGLMLSIFFLFWFRIATLIFALFVGTQLPGIATFLADLWSVEGVMMLLTGTVVGAMLAVLVFALSVVSIPMLLHRDISFVEAIISSLSAFARNPGALLIWAAIISLLTIAGIATFFFGLILVIPLLGHASWHAYRDLIRDAA